MKLQLAIVMPVAALITGYQLFVPPFIGLADNGDFPKIAGRLNVCSHGDRFIFFEPRYRLDPACYWDSHMPAGELPVAWAAVFLSRTFRNKSAFDIRWLGATHAVLYLLAMGGCLFVRDCLGPARRLFLAVIAIVMFTDVSYVSYFNSFYTDAFALIALAGLAGATLNLIQSPSVRSLLPFGLCAIAMICSKAQHAWIGIVLAAFLLRIAVSVSNEGRSLRVASILVAALLPLCSAWMYANTPVWYRTMATWNTVFTDILATSPDLPGDLRFFHLDDRYRRFAARNAFQFENDAAASYWIGDFQRRTGGYATVVRYYAAHPRLAGRRLAWCLGDLYNLRPRYLANFQKNDGYAPGSLSSRFAVWSDFKRWCYWRHPALSSGFYAISLVAMIRQFGKRWRTDSPQAIEAAFLIAVIACGELLIACFADSAADYRHRFLFHAATDIWICMCAAMLETPLHFVSFHETKQRDCLFHEPM